MKKNNKYFVIDSEGNYLIKGNINNKPFDGNNAPYVFTRNEAVCLVAQFDYTMEEVTD